MLLWLITVVNNDSAHADGGNPAGNLRSRMKPVRAAGACPWILSRVWQRDSLTLKMECHMGY